LPKKQWIHGQLKLNRWPLVTSLTKRPLCMKNSWGFICYVFRNTFSFLPVSTWKFIRTASLLLLRQGASAAQWFRRGVLQAPEVVVALQEPDRLLKLTLPQLSFCFLRCFYFYFFFLVWLRFLVPLSFFLLDFAESLAVLAILSLLVFESFMNWIWLFWTRMFRCKVPSSHVLGWLPAPG